MRKTLFPILILSLAGGAPDAGAAQSPIAVESRAAPERESEVVSDSTATREPDQIQDVPFRRPVVEDDTPAPMENQYLLQLLQRDVQELRGLVEELSFQLRAMRERQSERYQDLDRRIEALRDQPGNLGLPEIGSVAAPSETPTPGVESPGPAPTGSEDEKTIYDTALQLIRNRQYDLAIAQLQALIAQFPEGDFAANSYYWLGEVHAAKPEPDYEAARLALSQVISFFPDHRKVPDAMFKLGKVHHLMGDCGRSVELLDQVRSTYRTRSVAKLAEAYLRDKVDCPQ